MSGDDFDHYTQALILLQEALEELTGYCDYARHQPDKRSRAITSILDRSNDLLMEAGERPVLVDCRTCKRPQYPAGHDCPAAAAGGYCDCQPEWMK